MHDLLYERQDELGEEDLMRYAAELGLDLRRFEEDLTNDTTPGALRRIASAGIAGGQGNAGPLCERRQVHRS